MSKQTQIVGDFAYAMGVTDERERIIKLLEDVFVVGSAQAAIALIKGENK